jgi:predicted DNA-binding transcriptional regulator YafY
MEAKPEPGAQATTPRTAEVAKLVEAAMHHRRVTMRYHSFSSNREKTYALEPYRLLFGQGGLYVIGMVPEYGALRTFAVDRIEQLSLTEDRFEPLELPDDAFAHSLGVNQGTPERIEILFASRIARYVRERVWHPSQEITNAADGAVRLALNVVNDWALKSWILGFGALATVLSPPTLASEIARELEAAATNYVQNPSAAETPQ